MATQVIVEVMGENKTRTFNVITNYNFINTIKQRLMKTKIVKQDDTIYVYLRVTGDGRLALLECYCEDDDKESCDCFQGINTKDELIVCINDSTTPPITQIKQQPAQQTPHHPQHRPLCPSQLEWPASHNKLGNAGHIQTWRKTLENELTAAGIMHIFHPIEGKKLNDTTPTYKQYSAIGRSLIIASIQQSIINELPDLHDIPPHELITTITTKIGRKSLLKYVHTIKDIINATKGKQSIQAYTNQLTQLHRTLEAHRPAVITEDSNHMLVTILKSVAIIYGCGQEYDKHTSNMESKFLLADEQSHFDSTAVIEQMYREIQDEFTAAEIKIEDRKTMHEPNGYKPHGSNNNKGGRPTALLTQQQELTQEQKNLQYQQLKKFKCHTCLSNDHHSRNCPQQNTTCKKCSRKHMTKACAQYYNKILQQTTTSKPTETTQTNNTPQQNNNLNTNTTLTQQPHNAYITQQQYPHINPPPTHQQFMYPHPMYYIPPPQAPRTIPPTQQDGKQVRYQETTAQNYYTDDTNNDTDHAQSTQQ
eukprot:Pgem_evm1s19055